MKANLKIDHGLFQRLKNDPPQWWKNLKDDRELYIDIRKDNYINVYYNGGSIMKLEGASKYRAKINVEYIPLEGEKEYLPFNFQNDNISFLKHKPIELGNFSKKSLGEIKKWIKKFYPNSSEKGIQGRYVIKNKKGNGFFIDTEFQYDYKRIDMVWVDLEKKKIAFVELKTIGDKSLYKKTIGEQLKKYSDFAKKYKNELIKYYSEIYLIKEKLGLLPKFVKVKSLEDYELIEKPILLVGDCTQEWIKNNAEELNGNIKDVAFGSLYQGKDTYNFRIPYESSRNCFRLSEG
ncbi:hypothetical protein M1M97_01465 [Thermodesulfovibrionales bacterium]|nr:hypothetical protein [Thermodesulfovibrionales bacterium]MCL0067100.1 hypothetical protein [Thermodesulfovibrionales bacterium]MCL0083651.1 hypothetical protein [Thermodesulfovibrionales bacterium]